MGMRTLIGGDSSQPTRTRMSISTTITMSLERLAIIMNTRTRSRSVRLSNSNGTCSRSVRLSNSKSTGTGSRSIIPVIQIILGTGAGMAQSRLLQPAITATFKVGSSRQSKSARQDSIRASTIAKIGHCCLAELRSKSRSASCTGVLSKRPI